MIQQSVLSYGNFAIYFVIPHDYPRQSSTPKKKKKNKQKQKSLLLMESISIQAIFSATLFPQKKKKKKRKKNKNTTTDKFNFFSVLYLSCNESKLTYCQPHRMEIIVSWAIHPLKTP